MGQKGFWKNKLIFSEKSWSTWNDIFEEINGALEKHINNELHKIAFSVRNSYEAIGSVAYLNGNNADGLIVTHERLNSDVTSILSTNDYNIVYMTVDQKENDLKAGSVLPGRISMLTSGTTGIPKLIEHTWNTLNTLQNVKKSNPLRWLVPYNPGTYAWYQMVCMGLFLEDHELVFPSNEDPAGMLLEAAKHRVTGISSTPTFWRMAFLGLDENDLKQIPFKQISLGGEASDQAVLDQLRNIYPEASIFHIYASTEAGACIVVKDGKKGFPKKWIDNKKMKIVDNRLYLKSDFSATSIAKDEENWIDTCDLVEIRGDRVLFLGRDKTKMINVGGSKAYPADIESMILKNSKVLWCRVYPKKAPLVGFLVAADVVLKDNIPFTTAIEKELETACRENCPEFAVPRIWNSLSEIPVGYNLKAEIK